MAVAAATPQTWSPMSEQERAEFDRNGFLVIRSVLDADQIDIARTAILRVRDQVADAGGLGPGGALHQLSAVTACPEIAFLLDHPVAFRYIWSILGWNVHVYHSHIDVHPQIKNTPPDWWHWHQDGGRQNRELETDPRPRMSVKLAYWLSDVSKTGRGNFTVLPGSHLRNRLPGPPSRGVPWPAPEGALQITANPGDLVVFDRRLWHARSDNFSPVTRVGAFFGYTYRWVAGRDDVADLPHRPQWAGLNAVQRQLLGGAGDGSGDHAWGHHPQTTPLYQELTRRSLLDSRVPALIPLR